MSKTKHTDCKLSLDKTDIYFEGFMIAVTNPSEGANFLNPEQAEANAARLVKSWNMHDELIEALKEIQKSTLKCKEVNGDFGITPAMFELIFEKADKLIKQSEQ